MPIPADTTLWGQTLLFLTTLGGFGFQYLREERRRRWDREERDHKEKMAAEERVRQAAEVQRQLRMDAAQIKSSVDEHHQTMVHELTMNTEISRSAFHEANSMNQKIADLSKRYDELLRSSLAATEVKQQLTEVVNEAPRIREIQETVEETARQIGVEDAQP